MSQMLTGDSLQMVWVPLSLMAVFHFAGVQEKGASASPISLLSLDSEDGVVSDWPLAARRPSEPFQVSTLYFIIRSRLFLGKNQQEGDEARPDNRELLETENRDLEEDDGDAQRHSKSLCSVHPSFFLAGQGGAHPENSGQPTEPLQEFPDNENRASGGNEPEDHQEKENGGSDMELDGDGDPEEQSGPLNVQGGQPHAVLPDLSDIQQIKSR